MKSLLLFLGIFISTISIAQVKFDTGSTELDANLNVINSDAKNDLPTFKASLSVDFDVSTGKIDGMLAIGMTAGEVYLSLEISKIAKISVDKVIESYKSNKSKSWGYIAKEMGIKPGSSEFHALKGNCKNKKEKGNNGKGNSKSSNGKGNGNKGGKKK